MSFPDTSRDFRAIIYRGDRYDSTGFTFKKVLLKELFEEHYISVVDFTNLPESYNVSYCVGSKNTKITIYRNNKIAVNSPRSTNCYINNSTFHRIITSISLEIIDSYDKKIEFFYSKEYGKGFSIIVYYSFKKMTEWCFTGKEINDGYDLSFMPFPTDVKKIIISYVGSKIVNDIIYNYD